jgi:hypothetical protein
MIVKLRGYAFPKNRDMPPMDLQDFNFKMDDNTSDVAIWDYIRAIMEGTGVMDYYLVTYTKEKEE